MAKRNQSVVSQESVVTSAPEIELTDEQLAANRKAAMAEALAAETPEVKPEPELPGTPVPEAKVPEMSVAVASGLRKPSLNPELKITLLVTGNPKRPTSKTFHRFVNYFSEGCKTVGDALRLGTTVADLKWDEKHGFIKLG